jgi:uncharacterized protein (TIGR02145 family)
MKSFIRNFVGQGVCVGLMALVSCTDGSHPDPVSVVAGWGLVSSSVDPIVSGSSSSVDPIIATSSSSNGTSVASTGTPGAPLVYGGQTYKTVVIGTQTWMAENLNFTTSMGSWCYGNVASNCTFYGRLYDWGRAITVCPSGWHLPDTTEWTILETAVGGTATAGTKLKANSTLWSINTGMDNSGFSALPGGRFYSSAFNYLGNIGNWWTSTADGYGACFRSIYDSGVNNVVHNCNSTAYGFSVRCLQDSN